ncbi:MAG: single-stranded DNA-binding protein [Proteobacteria bacterium]|nr:single-stranded DNA-binding protein [Pseudomonadota bacterium]
MIDALISGKLIRDPTTKTGPSGKPYCNFLLTVFVGEESPVVVSGIAFQDVAQRIGKLGKGDALTVTGALKPSTWADKTTGETKHGLNVTVSACLSAYDVKKKRTPATGEHGEANETARPTGGVTRPYVRDDEPPPFDDIDF